MSQNEAGARNRTPTYRTSATAKSASAPIVTPAADSRCADANTTPAWTPAHGLRLRRAASWRLPPLDCGHRDPLDCRDSCRTSESGEISALSQPYEGDYWYDVGAHLTMAQLAAVSA